MKQDLIAVRVAVRERVASDVISLRLVNNAQGVPLPSFSAGAHIDVYLGDGLSRKYSLCNPPGQPAFYEIAVKRESASRGGSAYVHDVLRIGDILQVGAPLNRFPLASGASPSVLLAGGIGITPLLAMMHELQSTMRQFELHYFVRSEGSAAYVQMVRGHFSYVSNLYVGLSPSATNAQIEKIVGDIGSGAHLYFCGPPLFMDAVSAIATAHLPATNIHYEHFSAPICTTAAEGGRAEFTIELVRSQRVFSVPADKSITDVLYANGISIDTSCEAGVCGACRTAVLAGIPEHRDAYLRPEEKLRNDCVMPCVSRCRSGPLVLDI